MPSILARAAMRSTVLLLVAAVSLGCAASADGRRPERGFVSGQLFTQVDASVADTAAAVSEALVRRRVSLRSSEALIDSATFQGVAPRGEAVSVIVTLVEGPETEVRVRYGVFGDEAASQALMDEILLALEASGAITSGRR